VKIKILWIFSHFVAMALMISYFVYTPSCSTHSNILIVDIFYTIMGLNFCFTCFMFLATLQFLMESGSQN